MDSGAGHEGAAAGSASVAGVQPAEDALHSQRIGGATHLSAGGVAPDVLKREGR